MCEHCAGRSIRSRDYLLVKQLVSSDKLFPHGFQAHQVVDDIVLTLALANLGWTAVMRVI